MSSAPLTSADYAGMAAISKARRDNLSRMFTGTELIFAKYSLEKSRQLLLGDANNLAKAAQKLGKAARSGGKTSAALSSTGDIPAQAHELLSVASGMDFSAVKEIVTGEVTHSLVGELTPFIGVIVSSAKAAASWRAVVKNAADLYKGDYYLAGVLPGDPSAAADAVIVCIKRFLVANSAEAARNTAAAATKIAGLFADLGTASTMAVGAASALAKLVQDLAILGRDYRDMKAGNARLASPGTLDLSAFRDCPILGCYLLSCSDTSTVTNFFIADMGLPNWMSRVEAMKKNQLDPLITNANKAIITSHISIEGLASNKGAIAVPGFLDRQKAKIKYQFNQMIASSATRR